MAERTDVLVVGGGISGLSTAWWMARKGLDVLVWEAASQAGGKIRTHREGGYLTERAAGMIVNYRPEVDGLVHGLGLDDRKRDRDPGLNRYILRNGKLVNIPMRLPELLSSSLWSRRARMRLLGEPFIPRGGGDGESVAAFVRRRLGEEVLATTLDPFVAGTLASNPELAEASAVLPRLTSLERRYGSITLGMLIAVLTKRRRVNTAETFSFDGGMEALCAGLASAPGVRVRLGTRAVEVEPSGDGWRVTALSPFGERQVEAARLVLCTPADAASALLRGVNPALAGLLGQIDYGPIAVAHLGFPSTQVARSLDGTGFLVPHGEPARINGCLWMSRLFPGRAPPGHTLLTSYLGGARDPDAPFRETRTLLDQALGQLTPLLGLRGEPAYARVERHPRALPLYHGRYSRHCEAIRREVAASDGLYLTGNYLEGVSVRERIHQGWHTARAVSDSLGVCRGADAAYLHPLAATR